MISQTYPITGIKEGLGPAPGQTPLRQEISAWSENPENVQQVNLFLLALRHFQDNDEIPFTAKLSYFQIAGIHGFPLKPWDENTESKVPDLQDGYCTHNSVLFPTWHRPYLMLFEQRIYEIMLEIIAKFPEQQRATLLKHANAWRFPYWDWAVEGAKVPAIVSDAKRTVLLPSGLTAEIDNPLLTFRTPEPMGKYGITRIHEDQTHDAVDAPYDQARATSRYPPVGYAEPQDLEAWVKGVQKDDIVADALAEAKWYKIDPTVHPGRTGIRDAVHRLLSDNYFTTYRGFATTAKGQSDPKAYLSLEFVHNNIHNWVGGGGEQGSPYGHGHMTEVPVAALDPIFWLHHCNVDRQFAIWQALNPNLWFDKPEDQLPDKEGNWSTPGGTVVTPKTPLAPFHKDKNGTVWNSDEVRYLKDLGYSYPELQPWLPKYFVGGVFQEELYIADIKAQVNRLYSSTRTAFLAASPDTEEVKEQDYIVNVEYERFALGGEPFVIHIYVGQNKVGQIYNFVAPPRSTGCANCEVQQGARSLAVGQVPITGALYRDATNDRIAELQGLGKTPITHYLTNVSLLTWKVVTLDGQEVAPEKLPSLKIHVAGGKAKHFANFRSSSEYNEYEILYDITHGRVGGLNRPA
ncbi:Di-copper centre-containing protein [Sistotremastrum niveocremeum HHB9708]|uniref:tyrosinase n=1 Tax=Sistotremastrum niveocremeum HHB9708 TaxID=1314777 RepID=A0A164PTM7_9AGAM|nr:Di-copper centre-containing protein [Sistotremastrum niveocremeum HHB9708]